MSETRLTQLNKKVFDFHFIYHGNNGINKSIEFVCPICNKNVKALGLDDYISFHDFYENIEFFCSNCLSQFITYKDSKIKLKSKALTLGDLDEKDTIII